MIAVTEPQASINHYTAKGCLEKQKMKKRENILLDSRQPFMNRVCNLLHTPFYSLKIGFFRVMCRWACIKKDMALHLIEKSER